MDINIKMGLLKSKRSLAFFCIIFFVIIFLYGFLNFFYSKSTLYGSDNNELEYSTFANNSNQTVKIVLSRSMVFQELLYKHGFSVLNIRDIAKQSRDFGIDITRPVEAPQYIDIHYNDLSNIEELKIVIDSFNSLIIRKNGSEYKVIKDSVPIKKYLAKEEVNLTKNLHNNLSLLPLTKDERYKLLDLREHINVRNIKNGSILIVKEKFIGDNNIFSHYGRLLSVRLKFNNKCIYLFPYTTNGKTEFFFENGKSLAVSKFRLPLNKVIVSSGFGKVRTILGVTKVHKGVDLVGAVGTPIYASFDGIVKVKKGSSSYGNYILLQHKDNVESLYAHMQKFAPKISQNTKVKRGDLLGYIGLTGRTMGPHLHYEIRVNGNFMDPMRFKQVPRYILGNMQANHFKKYKDQMILAIKHLNSKTQIIY